MSRACSALNILPLRDVLLDKHARFGTLMFHASDIRWQSEATYAKAPYFPEPLLGNDRTLASAFVDRPYFDRQ
jgi:hypothetical protein